MHQLQINGNSKPPGRERNIIADTHCSNQTPVKYERSIQASTSPRDALDDYPIHHDLDNANPILTRQPNYKSQIATSISNNTRMGSNNTCTRTPTPRAQYAHSTNTNNSPMQIDSEDDMISDEPEPIPTTPPPEIQPLNNIFMNHPHYNTKNPNYQKALSNFLQTANCLSTSKSMSIPMNTVEVPIRSPEDPDNPRTILAAADSQSDIEAIGFNQIVYYKNTGQIKTDKKGITICTGNGRVHVNKYVPITVIAKNKVPHAHKFWCLESLPTYDFLLGKHLLHKLGWEYVNKYETWEHTPTNYDHIDTELDDEACTNYPWKGEPELDINAVQIENEDLRPFLRAKLKHYSDVIARHEWDSGRLTHTTPFSIDLIEEDHEYKAGFFAKEYWTNPADKTEMMRQIKGMEQHGLITEVTDEIPKYVSPIFSRSKKTGDVRIVFDYRKLNEITQKQLWTIPDPNKLMQRFKGKQFITSLDLKGGYWHIPIKESDRHKTSFIFNNTVYRWNVMPFGPTNAPMFFQMTMERIFGQFDFVTVYLDDIGIMSDTLQEHKEHLKLVFEMLEHYGIKLRLDKCRWGVSETEYLGFIVDKYGTKCKAEYVAKIMDVPVPNNKKALKRYLGLVQFLHKYVPQMQNQVSILTDLLKKEKNNIIKWNQIQLDAFHDLKEMVQSVKPLAHADVDKPFHVFADASKYGIGGMLAQVDDNGDMRPVAYCSKVFSSTQTRWHVSEQEVYAAIYCTEKWSDLLRHKKFTLHTDHRNLQKLFNKAVNFKSGKLFRWAVRIQDHHFQCQYIKGSENVVADYLSRESVATQYKSQFKSVKEFYEASHQSNSIRDTLSESGGVDIHELYIQHLATSILSDTSYIDYFDTIDPFKQTNNPNNFNYMISDEMMNYLGIEIEDQPILQHNHLPLTISNVTHHQSIDTRPIPKKRTIIPPPKPPPPSKQTRSSVSNADKSSISSQSANIETLREQLKIIPYPKLYRSPTDQMSNDNKNVRRSPRIANKTRRDPRHKPLLIRKRKAFRGKQMWVAGAQQLRQQKIDMHKNRNQAIINEKPYEHTWNPDLLINTKYYVPIQDDYGELFDATHHVRTNLMRIKQWFDPICHAIINFLATGNRSLISDLPKYIQRYVLSGRFFLNPQKILCYKHHTRITKEKQVAPASLLASILKKAHGKLHHGISKMRRIIINNMGLWWPKMNYHISVYCRACITCQHTKPGVWKSYRKGKMTLFAATKPFEQISTDIVGPLPMSHSGNRYIVTMIDKFSRYCMLVAVPDITALSVVKAIDKWVTTFGPPKSILSDNGPQFISSIYRDYMSNHKDIKYKYTSTYYPQCNGQIERLHKWVKERLSVLAYDGQLNFVGGADDWSDYLSIIQYTYNATPNRMTSYSPMDIVLGRDDYQLNEYKFDPDKPQAYVEFLAKRQEMMKLSARRQSKEYDEIRAKTYNKNRNKSDDEYEIGQRVLWNIGKQNPTGKLGAKWIGPYEIVDIFNNYGSFKLKVIPLSPLERDNPMNPIKIPKRGKPAPHSRNNHSINEFIVPRTQIKPYYKSYEEHFDGTQRPNNILINEITKMIYNNNINDINNKENEQLYKCLFHIYQEQTNMGFVPNRNRIITSEYP